MIKRVYDNDDDDDAVLCARYENVKIMLSPQ